MKRNYRIFFEKVGVFRKRLYLCGMPKSREEAEKAGIQVKETQHSMKRRFPCHNYSDKGTYMLTLVVEGRKPLFGTLQGDGHAPADSENEPRVALSPLGKAIRDCEIREDIRLLSNGRGVETLYHARPSSYHHQGKGKDAGREELGAGGARL